MTQEIYSINWPSIPMLVTSRVLASSIAPLFSQTPRQFVDPVSASTIKKMTAVAAFIFGGAVIERALALTSRVRTIALLSIGAFFGMVTDFFLTVLGKKAAHSTPPTVPLALPSLSAQPPFLLKVDHLDKCVEKKYVVQQKKCIEDLAHTLHRQFDLHPLPSNLDIDSLDQLLDLNDQIQTSFNLQKNTQQIYEELSRKVGKELADLAISHPTLLSDYLQDPHFAPSELVIRFIAQRVKTHFNNAFDILLETIRKNSERDLFLDEQFIEEKFEIARLFETLTPQEKQERRDALQRIINQAYITREFKQKIRLIKGEPDEAALLTCLGYEVEEHSPYYQRDLIYQMISEIVQSELQPDLYVGPLHSIKQLLHTCAVKARLRSIHITQDNQIQKFLQAYESFKAIKARLKESCTQISFPLPAHFPLTTDSMIVQSMQEDFLSILTFESEKIVSHLFQDPFIREKFHDPACSTEAFHELLRAKEAEQRDQQEWEHTTQAIQQSDIFGKDIHFYLKWGRYIKAQMVQGMKDEHQILGVGVCWGLCQRICLEGEMQPDLSAEEFAKTIVIKDSDRFLQSIHTCSARLFAPNASVLPTPLLHREGLESDNEVFDFDDFPNEMPIANWFSQNRELLAKSSGWIRLSLTISDLENTPTHPIEATGHALAIRYDASRNRFWVFDPNIGFLCFEDEESQVNIPQVSLMLFIKELIQYHYPLTCKVRGFQHLMRKQTIHF